MVGYSGRRFSSSRTVTQIETAPPPSAPSLRLIRLVRLHLGLLLLALVASLVSTAAFLVVPYAIRLLTDSVFVQHRSAELNRIALLLLGAMAVSALFSFARGYTLAYIGGRIVADVRLRLYRHLHDPSLSFYDERRSGDLMSRLTADTTLVQAALTTSLVSLLQQSAQLVAIVVIVLLLDWRLALLTMALAPVVAVTAMLVGRRTRRLSQRAQEELGQSGVVLEETLSSMRVVKAFGRQTYEIGRYGAAVDRSFRLGLSASLLHAAFESTMMVVAFGAMAAVLWFGGHEVLAGRLTPGGLISFLFYLTMLIGPLQTMASVYGEFQQAAGSAARVFEILDTPPAVVDAPHAYRLPFLEGRVEIRDLRFRYGPQLPLVLRGVNAVTEPGQTVALVGPSGAGKTTVMSLLPRFYDPTSGELLIDGHDTSAVTMESLRAAVAIVPQEATLFGGTVRQNIAYGRLEATAEEIEEAARNANAHEFIGELPQGYETVMGDRGVKLSAGQRQRVAIARAMLKDAPLLILDEATSAQDNESEALVQQALSRLMAGRTTFVIAHRLTTVERADLILVLDRGRIVEQGTHHDLLSREGLYWRLYTRAFQEGRSVLAHQP